MNTTTSLSTALLCLIATSFMMSMEEQPRTPRTLQPANTPSYLATQFVSAINAQNFPQATVLLNRLPSHPVANNCKALFSKTMAPNNIFYNKANFDGAFLEPFNRESLKLFAESIMYSGQKPERSEDSKIYFYRAQKRFCPSTTPESATTTDHFPSNVISFISAINSQKYNSAITLLNDDLLHPIAKACIELLSKTMSENNIFYSKANFDSADIAPFDRKCLMRFVRGIIKSGQKPRRSSESRQYYAEIEQRVFPSKEITL